MKSVYLSIALAFGAHSAHAQAQRTNQAPEAPAGLSGGPQKGAKYVVDPTHTFVMYEIGHYGTTTNRGRFSTKEGRIEIDDAGKTGKVDITMDISTVNTGVDLLNRHIQSKDFFDVAEFPTGRFVADRITFSGDSLVEVPGSITLHGKTAPVVLKANKFNCYVSPIFSRQVCGGDFETTITRSDFGITWGLNFGFEDKVRLIVQVEAVQAK